MVFSNRWAAQIQKQSFTGHLVESDPITVNHYLNGRPSIWIVDTPSSAEIGIYDYMLDTDGVDVGGIETADKSFAVAYPTLDTAYVFTDMVDGEIHWGH